MAVSIEDIKKLRAMTGAGLADVKKALTEAEGDFECSQVSVSFIDIVYQHVLSVCYQKLFKGHGI